jgi:hypothetical protein
VTDATIPSVDLTEIIPASCFDAPCYCSREYWLWEEQVARPALIEKGWTVLSWHDGERDSFGPLTRYAVCILRGRHYRLFYG